MASNAVVAEVARIYVTYPHTGTLQDAIELWARELKHFEDVDVLGALEELRWSDSEFFPSLGKFLNMVRMHRVNRTAQKAPRRGRFHGDRNGDPKTFSWSLVPAYDTELMKRQDERAKRVSMEYGRQHGFYDPDGMPTTEWDENGRRRQIDETYRCGNCGLHHEWYLKPCVDILELEEGW